MAENKEVKKGKESKENINIIDKNENLILKHFDDCTNDTTLSIREMRGVVYDNNDKVVCKTFPYIIEYPEGKLNEYKDKFPMNTEFYKSQEGTIVRLFKYNNKWYLSTFRKLDAFNSRWGSLTSYGDMFVDGLYYQYKNGKLSSLLTIEDKKDLFDQFCSILNPTVIYTFIITPNKSNRIVCKIPNYQMVYLSGIFSREGKYLGLSDDKLGNIFPTLEKVNDPEDEMKKIDYFNNPGIVAYIKGDKNEVFDVIKFTKLEYTQLATLRNNQSNIKYQYFEMKKGNKGNNLSQFLELYSDRKEEFDNYENELINACKYIHFAYYTRYIQKIYNIVPPIINYILKECHNKYYSTKIPTTFEKVFEVVMNQDTRNIMNILTEIKNEFSKFDLAD